MTDYNSSASGPSTGCGRFSLCTYTPRLYIVNVRSDETCCAACLGVFVGVSRYVLACYGWSVRINETNDRLNHGYVKRARVTAHVDMYDVRNLFIYRADLRFYLSHVVCRKFPSHWISSRPSFLTNLLYYPSPPSSRVLVLESRARMSSLSIILHFQNEYEPRLNGAAAFCSAQKVRFSFALAPPDHLGRLHNRWLLYACIGNTRGPVNET